MLRVGPSRTGRDRVARDRPGPEREPGGVKQFDREGAVTGPGSGSEA